MKKNVEKGTLIDNSVKKLTMHLESNLKRTMNEEDAHNSAINTYWKIYDAFNKMTIEENELLNGILSMIQSDIDFDRATKSKMFQK